MEPRGEAGANRALHRCVTAPSVSASFIPAWLSPSCTSEDSSAHFSGLSESPSFLSFFLHFSFPFSFLPSFLFSFQYSFHHSFLSSFIQFCSFFPVFLPSHLLSFILSFFLSFINSFSPALFLSFILSPVSHSEGSFFYSLIPCFISVTFPSFIPSFSGLSFQKVIIFFLVSLHSSVSPSSLPSFLLPSLVPEEFFPDFRLEANSTYFVRACRHLTEPQKDEVRRDFANMLTEQGVCTKR